MANGFQSFHQDDLPQSRPARASGYYVSSIAAAFRRSPRDRDTILFTPTLGISAPHHGARSTPAGGGAALPDRPIAGCGGDAPAVCRSAHLSAVPCGHLLLRPPDALGAQSTS